jgi:DNA-binding response OmpR family regulator
LARLGLSVAAAVLDSRPMPRRLLPLLIALALLLVGGWEWRTVGRAADAESERMRTALTLSANAVAHGLDDELAETARAFALRGPADDTDEIGRRLAEWRRTAAHPRFVTAVYVVSGLRSDAPNEPTLALGLVDRFRGDGYDVTHVSRGDEALRVARERAFDLLILDVMLPALDGFAIARELRKDDNLVPVLMLTARGHVADRVAGLKLGADDYLVKPFEVPDLMARIEALLRRAAVAPAGARVSFGDVVFDARLGEARRGGEPVALTPVELRLLAYFLAHPNALISRDELLDRVWGYESDVFSRTVDVHIAALRQKLEPSPARPRHFITVRGAGYRFRP